MKIFILFLFLYSTLFSQCLDYKYEYVYDYKTMHLSPRSIKLIIFTEEDCNLRIQNPQLKIDESFFLEKNKTFEKAYLNIPFSENYEFLPVIGYEKFTTRAFDNFYIYSDKNVACYVVGVNERQDGCRSDATRIISQNNLRNKYRLNILGSNEINQNSNGRGEKFLTIHSFYNNNEITIDYDGKRTSPDISNRYSKKINMNKNETLPILFKNLYDVSAISIDSKLPIQILLGSNAELITKDGIGNFGYNTGEIFHTQYPIDYLGIEYVLLPNNKNNINSIFKEFYYKIVPIENNTEIKINNLSKGIFNKQDYYIEYSTVPIVINSNKKISVTQYLTGRYEEEGTYYHESSKPNMVQLLPTNQMLKNLTFNLFHFRECINCNSNNQSNDSAFINILAYKEDDIFIDENKINGFINIDNSNFKYRSLNLDFGVHKITSQKGISVICYCQTSHYGFRRNNYFYNPQGTFINNKVNILLNDRFYRETICFNSQFILSADAPEEAVEFDWTINDTLNVSGKEVNLDLPKPGKYNIKLKIDNDDSQVYEWTTTRLEEIKSDLDSVIYLCNDSLSNISMNVSGGGTSKSITWFPSENIKDPTQFNIEFIKPLKENTKLFYEVIDEHCCSYLDSVDIQITNVYPKITTTKNNFCYGGSTTLSLDKDYDSIIWNTGESTKDIIVKESGVYSATVTKSECTNDTNILINVNQLPTIDIEAPNGTILCDGGSIILEAKVPQNTSIVWNDGTRLAKRTFSKSGTYTITAEDIKTGCKNSKSIIVSDIENLKAEIQGDPTFCDGESTTLTIQPQGESYLWNTGETTQSIVVNQSGLYSATITTDTDCKIDAEIEVIKNPLPTFQLLGETIICNNSTTIYPDKDYDFYKWSNGESSKSITIDKTGNYDLTVTDNNGCKATQNITITESKPEITLSNRNIDFGELLFGNSKLDVITSDRDIIFLKNSSIFNVNYQNKNINISFNPKDIGQFLDTIIIESIGECKTLDTIYIKGICKAEILAKVSNSEGYPSDIVNNTVNLELLQNIPLPKDFNYEIDIQINEDAIQIQDATTFNYKNNKLEINIADYLNKTSYDEEVKKINSKIMLAKNLENELNITKFETENQYLIPIRQNGNIKIYEICLYEARLIENYNEALIKQISKTKTTLNTYFAGKYDITISDIIGKILYHKAETTTDDEIINFNYNLGNGTYIIKIQEPGKTQTRKIVFVE